MDHNLTGLWVSFFTAAGIPSDVAATYALTFTENRIQNDMLLDLNKEYLRDMGISRMGDVIAILRHAKQVHESAARDRVLSSATSGNKVPVAAVTARLTVQKPSSPASRILEHYTRNTTPETSPTANKGIKRKIDDTNTDSVSTLKMSRLIRFGSSEAAKVVDIQQSKQTVFARLGNSEALKQQAQVAAKPIFSRLGAKNDAEVVTKTVIPIPRDALKYEGILKSTPAPIKKTVTVIATKDNVRKIALGTMRADETPVSIKEKLALSTQKSVKFSNTVQYKEIDRVKPQIKQKVKFTPVFNKPERRLSMPDGSQTQSEGVKARLGVKNVNNFTITKNIFNRLGV